MIVFQSKEALESCLRMFGLVGTLQNSFAVVSRIAIVGLDEVVLLSTK